MKLEAGRDGKNAVITKWYDPIKEHDEAVKDVEEKVSLTRLQDQLVADDDRTKILTPVPPSRWRFPRPLVAFMRSRPGLKR